MRVSELIRHEGIKTWNDGDIITIEAGTGAGKSYFIKNMLYSHAEKNHKKILFLIHRTNCVNQFQNEIVKDKKTDTIHIRTYQSLEADYINNRYIDFSNYQYIVCDEFHYFMTDASFNKFTDISLNIILEQTNKTRIFMSATSDYMSRYIKGYKKLDIIEYKLPINFDFIRSLQFYNKDESLHKMIKLAIEQNQKCIFFIEKAEDAYKLYEQYREYCLFNCSKNNKKFYKYVDEKKITNMLKDEKFNELILITTTCMDAGVNIRDEDLTHVICDVRDTDTLIQCIGRKRIQNINDKIHLLIKSINNKSLGGMITQLNKRREMARFLRENSVLKYIERYPRDYDISNIVYMDIVENNNDKGTLKVNELMYFKCLLDCAKIERMINNFKGFGYCKYLAHKLGFFDSDEGRYTYSIFEEENSKMSLEQYLSSMTGQRIYDKEEKEILFEMVDIRNGKNNRLIKNFNTIAAYIKEEFNSKYILIKNTDNQRKLEDGSENKNRGKVYFLVLSESTDRKNV